MKRALTLTVLMLFVGAGIALASVGVRNSDGLMGSATDIYISTGFGASSFDGSIYTLSAATAAISAGAINGAVIGGTSPAAGTFTNLTGTTYTDITGEAINTGAAVALSSANTLLTGTNMAKNSIFAPSVSGTYTLDTGANLIAANPTLTAGQMIPFTVSNGVSGTFTLAGNTGMTIAAAWTVPTLTSRRFNAIYAGSNAFTVY